MLDILKRLATCPCGYTSYAPQKRETIPDGVSVDLTVVTSTGEAIKALRTKELHRFSLMVGLILSLIVLTAAF